MNTFYVLCADFRRMPLILMLWLVYCFTASATLICPPNQTITAPPQSCEATLDFSSLVWSSTVPLTDTLFNPGPGHVFPLGLTPVSLTGVEVGGGIVTCAFTVTVQGNNNSPMACDDDVPVFLESNCTKTITLDMMMESIYGCPSNYTIARITPMGGIQSPAIMDEGDVGETVTIRVMNTVNGQSCWGGVEVVAYGLPMSITCPPDTVIDCNMEALPSNCGEASYLSCLPADEVTLTYLDSYTDFNCGDNLVSAIARFWKVTDQYSNERICTQNIQVRRNTLSQISLPIDTVFSCSAVNLNPLLTDPTHAGLPAINGVPINATCDFSFDYDDVITSTCEGSLKIVRTWTVVDWCDTEVVQQLQIIKVLDTKGPEIQLADTIFISTNPSCGFDAILPEALVTEECSSFLVQVVTSWDTIDGNGGLTVAAVPAGSYPGKYLATDACGNIAEHPIVIQVQDGTLVSCPPNTTIDCDFFIETLEAALNAQNYSALEQFGEMQFYANCLVTPTLSVALDINDCKSGTITRTLGAEELPDQCIQTITITPISDFIVEFPADVTVICEQNSTIPNDSPVLFGVNCEQIETTYTEEIFNVVADACYKIVRTWVVQNTCISTGSDTAPDLIETQLGFPDCDLNGDGSCSNRTVKAGVDGYISFQQVIKVQDNTPPVFVNGCSIPDVIIEGGACFTELEIPIPEVAECTNWVLSTQILINNGWHTVPGSLPNIPTGTYQVSYTATDYCHSQTYCWTTLKVKENTPPIIQCLQDLQTIYSPHSGVVDVYAQDYVISAQDNCGGYVSLSFTQSPGEDIRQLSCNDIELDFLDIFAIDNNGNQSFCQVPIQISSEADCSIYVAGKIKTESGEGVKNVNLHSAFGATTTDSTGRFFVGVTYDGSGLVLTPSKNENHKNGVTTFDMVLIRKHVLDIERFDSPYKIIAADANRSNSVSTFDLVVLTKLIINEIDVFPNNTSWRFVPKYWFFPNPNNPFQTPFPESYNSTFPIISELCDFIAIKIGDVNGSADPSLLTNETPSKNSRPHQVEDD